MCYGLNLWIGKNWQADRLSASTTHPDTIARNARSPIQRIRWTALSLTEKLQPGVSVLSRDSIAIIAGGSAFGKHGKSEVGVSVGHLGRGLVAQVRRFDEPCGGQVGKISANKSANVRAGP